MYFSLKQFYYFYYQNSSTTITIVISNGDAVKSLVFCKKKNVSFVSNIIHNTHCGFYFKNNDNNN